MMSYLSPLEMMYKWEKETPNKVFLNQPFDGKWHTWTWKQAADEVRGMAAWLKKQNFPPGSRIAIISKNCAHWIMSDLAIMMSGHVSVPMYPNLTENSVRQILEHSESVAVFVGKLDDYKSMKPGVPEGLTIITYPMYGEKGYPVWDELIKTAEPITENVVRDPKELATIIYTSGTTGMPKGVMHKFHNLGFVITNALSMVKQVDGNSRFFSYLPLSHIAERILVEMGGIYSGGSISFAESLDKFALNLQEVQPTVFLGVPRIWAKFQQGILEKMPQKKLDFLLKIPILNSIIKKKIRTKLGLRDATNIFTGAAPISIALLEWFKKMGITIQEAYAMTENCCYSHVTLNHEVRFGYVGKPLMKCEVKLGENNEVLVRHEALMDGYYKEPEMSRDSFVDGFLRTGDEGFIDKDGYLKITGRVKDIFKTSKGKYVAPNPIEMKFEDNPHIDQICLVGANVPQPIALITLTLESKKIPKEVVSTDLLSTLERVNPQLDQHEQIKKLVILQEEWTIENGLLTPTLKIKRNEVDKRLGQHYENWYDLKEPIVWE